jgi:hypothetical protein
VVKRGITMAIRTITDPYHGRGVGISVGDYGIEIMAGVCNRLIGFKVIATPPFDTHKINAGERDIGGFLEIAVQASLAWLTLHISIHRWTEQ